MQAVHTSKSLRRRDRRAGWLQVPTYSRSPALDWSSLNVGLGLGLISYQEIVDRAIGELRAHHLQERQISGLEADHEQQNSPQGT